MTLHVHPVPEGTAVVALHGEIDMTTADDICGVVDIAIRASYTDLVLDFADVTFMDSQGISALIVGRQAMEAAGGTLAIRNPSPSVRRVLELTQLDSVFLER